MIPQGNGGEHMATSSGGKRTLVFEGDTYYWYVAPDYDNMQLCGDMNELHIAAADRSFLLKVPLDSSLRPGAEKRFPFPIPDAVTPETVRRILEFQRL